LFLLIIITIFSFCAYAKDISLFIDNKEMKVYGISTEEFEALKYTPKDTSDANIVTKNLVGSLHQMGYVAAEGFVISDHEIFLNQGLITIVNVFGANGKSKLAIEKITKRLVGKRPNVDELDEILTHINALSGFDATFALEASKNKIIDPRGWTPQGNTSQYTLIVKVADQAQSYGAISLDSTPRNLFQRNRATITQTFNSVLVGGDHIQGSLTHIWGDNQKDQNEGSVTYFVPLLENGLYAELYGSYTASKNEIQPNVTRDFQGTNFTGIIGYPILRSHNETLTILGGVGYQGEDQDAQPNASVKALHATVFYNHSDP